MTQVTLATEPTGAIAPEPTTPVDDTPARPEWLPEGFNSPEDLAKAFADTKAAHTRATQELAALKKGEPPKEEPETDAAPDATGKTAEGKELEVKAPDPTEAPQVIAPEALEPYRAEFVNTGTLSEESKDHIVENVLKGLDPAFARSLIDDYVEGQKTRALNTATQYKTLAGGEENYNSMVSWAAANLDKPAIEAYNRAVNSGDYHTASLAINGLKAQYEAANGRAPRLLSGNGNVAPKGGFNSTAELMAAMKDPKYKTDPAYRQQVQERLAESNI